MIPLPRENDNSGFPISMNLAAKDFDPKRVRFSLGRVLRIVFLFVVISIAILIGEEFFIARKMNKIYDSLESVAKAPPNGHVYRNDVESIIGFSPNKASLPPGAFDSTSEEYTYSSFLQIYRLRVSYWDQDGVGKPYVFSMELESRWR